MKSRKHKEAFWLMNLVRFRLSSHGVLENHFRKECYGSLIEETALHACITWSILQATGDCGLNLIDKIILGIGKHTFCVAFRFMTD